MPFIQDPLEPRYAHAADGEGLDNLPPDHLEAISRITRGIRDDNKAISDAMSKIEERAERIRDNHGDHMRTVQDMNALLNNAQNSIQKNNENYPQPRVYEHVRDVPPLKPKGQEEKIYNHVRDVPPLKPKKISFAERYANED